MLYEVITSEQSRTYSGLASGPEPIGAHRSFRWAHGTFQSGLFRCNHQSGTGTLRPPWITPDVAYGRPGPLQKNQRYLRSSGRR